MNHEALFERAKKVTPGGVHSPVRAFRGVGGTPIFMRSAKGALIEDINNKQYVDFCMSWGPMILGHKNENIAHAVHEALERGWSLGTADPYSLELAELVCTRIPWIERIRFVCSGTEAVMSALRVARAATGRSKVLKFDGCYHGHADSLLVRAGSGLAGLATPDSAGVTPETASHTLIAPLADIEVLDQIFDRSGSEIAAAIIEPLPANFGLLPQTPAFLLRLAELCKAHGAILVFDEVISGFRVSFGGMAEILGIKPDLVTYGKILGGGFPVGAYGGRADLMDLVAPAGPVYQAGTLSANPVAISAGLATLKMLEENSIYRRLELAGKTFAARLEELARKCAPELAYRVVRVGSILWPVFGQVTSADGSIRSPGEIPTEHRERFPKFFHCLAREGVFWPPSAYEVGFLSTAHDGVRLDHAIEAFETAFKEVSEA